MVVFILLESNFVTSVGALYGDTTVQLSVILSVDVFDCSSVSVSSFGCDSSVTQIDCQNICCFA